MIDVDGIYATDARFSPLVAGAILGVKDAGERTADPSAETAHMIESEFTVVADPFRVAAPGPFRIPDQSLLDSVSTSTSRAPENDNEQSLQATCPEHAGLLAASKRLRKFWRTRTLVPRGSDISPRKPRTSGSR